MTSDMKEKLHENIIGECELGLIEYEVRVMRDGSENLFKKHIDWLSNFNALVFSSN